MKRLLLFSFLISSFFSFSQSEIWGIRLNTDDEKGGYLYSLDSASNRIVIEHYLTNEKELTVKSEIFYDSIMKCLFGIANQVMYKYDLVHRTIESQIIEEEVIGSFVKASNGYLYILERNGILKVNPNDLSVENIGPMFGQFVLPDSTVLFQSEIGQSYGLCKATDNNLVFSNYIEDNTYYWDHCFIYSLNTSTDSIEMVYRTATFPERENLIPKGKFHQYNDLLYSLFSMNDEISLYSFNPHTNAFDSVRYLNEIAQNETELPNTISADGIFYGKSREVNTTNNKLFQYNINNQQFQFLTDINDDNLPRGTMITDSQNDLYMILDYFSDSAAWSTFYKYNTATNQLDSLFRINSRYWYSLPHYEDIGPVNTFNDGLISFMDSESHPENFVVFYNVELKRLDTIASLPFNMNYTDSLYMPYMYCETGEGNILFYNTRMDVISDSSARFYANLKEFDPQTKILTKKPEFEIPDDAGSAKMVHMKDELFFLSILSDDIIIYDASTNEYETIDLPFHNYGTWVKESENSLIFTNENGIYRYELGNTNLEMVYEPGVDTVIMKTALYMENKILIHNILGEELLCLDLLSNEINPIFSFDNITEDINDLIVLNLFTSQEYIYMIVNGSIGGILYRFNPETNELTLIPSDLISKYKDMKFVENLTKDGLYITGIDESNQMEGIVLMILMNNSDGVEIVEFFNDSQNYNNIQVGQDINHLPLIQVKRKPIHRWIGTLNNDWYETENWSNGVLPTDSSSVNIMSDVPFYPNIDTNIKMKNLFIYNEAEMILEANAQIQISGDFKNNGHLKMLANNDQRSSLIIDGKFVQIGMQKYVFCADSIKGKTLANPMKAVEKYVQPFYSEAGFNENTFVFSDIHFYPHYSETCQALQYTCQDTTLEFKGNFNHGVQSLQIPWLSDENLYPLSNPYPSSFNWNNTQTTFLTHQACYFYNQEENTFTATVDGIGNHPPIIRPLEVFWVYGNGEESIQVDQSAFLHEHDYEEEIPDRKVLSLQVTGVKKTDKTLIAFNNHASKNYDPKLDAIKFIKNETNPHIFTKTEEDLLMINQHPDTTMMDLFVQMGSDGNMKIKLSENHGFDFLVLEDLIWHTRTDLLEDDYEFDYFTSDGHYPFKLYFKPWVLEPIEEADIQMYYYPEFLVVKSRKQVKNADITFYDLAGRVVLEFSEQNFFHIEKPIHIPAGHYIVQLRSGDLVVNQKILVR